MKYFSVIHETGKVEELTAEEARFCLKGQYKGAFVDEIIDTEQGFRLRTRYRDIWTKTDEGLVPIAGFYGTVG